MFENQERHARETPFRVYVLSLQQDTYRTCIEAITNLRYRTLFFLILDQNSLRHFLPVRIVYRGGQHLSSSAAPRRCSLTGLADYTHRIRVMNARACVWTRMRSWSLD